MTLKLCGAVLVLFGCGGCGFAMAAAQRREEREFRNLLRALEYMECELQFHHTPLPQLCRMAAVSAGGCIGKVLVETADVLDRQTEAEAVGCMELAMDQIGLSSRRIREILESLGRSLGRFDLPGQLRGLASVKGECTEQIQAMSDGRENRLRSYQTLGLCAGAALAILFL